MKKSDIHLDDITRILFGSAPAEFLAETLLRTLIVYLFVLVTAQFLGKRMKGQLSVTEMAIMLMIGAVASVAMQVPDRGILQGLMLLTLILILQRGVTWLEVRSARFERLTQGTAVMLIKDGILQLDTMARAPITREELFAELRSRNIPHLGQVDRMYFEACGIRSIYQSPASDRPGLSVWPETDTGYKQEERRAPDALQACTNCGQVQHAAPAQECRNCRRAAWTKAIL